jgi:hypothetical protein
MLEPPKQLFSYHVFMFPFKWQHLGLGEGAPMSERFKLEKFEEKLRAGSGWRRSEFELNTAENYNEFNYFYGHVREILYDLGNDLDTTSSQANEHLIRHYEYQPGKNEKNEGQTLNQLGWQYRIEVGQKHYQLHIDSIHLNVYSTGTAVLSFHLRNFTHPGPEEVLRINQYGRRLYPPFYALGDASANYGHPDPITWADALEGVKDTELPSSVSLGPPEVEQYKEDFLRYGKNDPIPKGENPAPKEEEPTPTEKPTSKEIIYGPFLLPAHIAGLFPDNFFATSEKEKDKQILIQPVLDDRMFVLCWYGSRDLTQALKVFDPDNQQYAYVDNEWWYKYLFVDAGMLTCGDRLMRARLLDEHTYSRWVEPYGTLYGVSRYSFVALTSGLTDASYVVRHVQTMYYKMVELALVQRATIIAFADEVTHISGLQDKKEEEWEKSFDQITDLYRQYIVFINKIYFREVTAQEQGIELYDLLQKHLRIPGHLKDLDGEIKELHTYANLRADAQKSRTLRRISVLSAVFLPLSFVAGIVGGNLMPGEFNKYLGWTNTTLSHKLHAGIVIILFVSLSMLVGVDFAFKLKFNERKLWKWLTVRVLYFIIGLALTVWYYLIIKENP